MVLGCRAFVFYIAIWTTPIKVIPNAAEMWMLLYYHF